MTSPAVRAIQQTARRHLSDRMSLRERRVAIIEMVSAMVTWGIAETEDLKRQERELETAELDALWDARRIAREERGGRG